jgi:flavin reductase (DIM6/NTAB) family NADH-FMN oxidoreductase RutF
MTGAFDADLATLTPRDRYKLLCALIVPRPIALVTTLGGDGTINAAPFSFFNVFAEEPALVALGLFANDDGSLKDTSANIDATGAFTVNLIDEALAARMNTCAVNFPAEMSEIDAAQLSTLPGVAIPVPRIAEAPAALECRHYKTLEVSAHRRLCLGEVIHVHARAGIVDPTRMYVNLDNYKPVARMFGNLYAGLGPPFELKRQTYAEWRISSSPGTGPKGDRSNSPAGRGKRDTA